MKNLLVKEKILKEAQSKLLKMKTDSRYMLAIKLRSEWASKKKDELETAEKRVAVAQLKVNDLIAQVEDMQTKLDEHEPEDTASHEELENISNHRITLQEEATSAKAALSVAEKEVVAAREAVAEAIDHPEKISAMDNVRLAIANLEAQEIERIMRNFEPTIQGAYRSIEIRRADCLRIQNRLSPMFA